MKRALATTFLILLLAVVPGRLCRAEIVAPALADRVPNLGPEPGKTLAAGDSGLSGMHLSLDRKTLWLGRAGGVRKIDLATGAWKFLSSARCSTDTSTMGNIIAMADTGDALWALTAPEGRICRYDYATQRWSIPGSWKMREYVVGGNRMVFDPSTRRLYVNGQGGPDSEGIAVIDPVNIKWLKLFKTKPVYDFTVNGNAIFAATWDGLLRIDIAKNTYQYTLHSQHGCGAEVTDLMLMNPSGMNAKDPGSLMPVLIGTKPARHTELGLDMKVFKDGIAVFAPAPGKPYSFRWLYYGRDESKRLNADYYRLFQTRDMDTPGGLCWQDGNTLTWKGLYKKSGLPGNTIRKLANGGNVVFAATDAGLAVIDSGSMKVTKTLPEIKNVIDLIAVPEGLWVAAEGGPVYFIKNEKLGVTKASAPAKPAK